MKYSQFRTALLTFTIGLAGVPFLTPLYDKWSEPFIDLPQAESDTPINIRVCPEPPTGKEAEKLYREHGYLPVKKASGINCDQGGGGGGSGREDVSELLLGSKATYPRKARLKSSHLKH